MYAALSTYCILDYFQTIALIGVGYIEANPIVVLITGESESWERLLYIKVLLLFALGILLLIKGNKK